MELEATKAAASLTQYGAIGVLGLVALVAVIVLWRDSLNLRKELKLEQQARVDDAKKMMALALEIQEKTITAVNTLRITLEAVKDRKG
jgi:hypothetical protein